MKTISLLTARTGRAVRSIALASLFVGGVAPYAISPATAQEKKADDVASYTLKKRSFVSGEVNRYRLTMKNKVGEQDVAINMVFKETTKDAKANGEYTVTNEFESATANIGGAEQDISQFLPVFTIKRDDHGKTTVKAEGGLEQASSQLTPMMEQLSTMQESYLPKMPVKVGDKWKVSISAPGPGGATVKSDGEATLVGTETVAGIKSLKLKVSSDVDSQAANTKAHGESIVNIDPDSGKLVKMQTKIEGTAQGMPLTQEIEMSLLPTDKKTAGATK